MVVWESGLMVEWLNEWLSGWLKGWLNDWLKRCVAKGTSFMARIWQEGHRFLPTVPGNSTAKMGICFVTSFGGIITIPFPLFLSIPYFLPLLTLILLTRFFSRLPLIPPSLCTLPLFIPLATRYFSLHPHFFKAPPSSFPLSSAPFPLVTL